MTSTRGHSEPQAHEGGREAGVQAFPGVWESSGQRGGKELPQTAEEEESEKNSRTHTHEAVL